MTNTVYFRVAILSMALLPIAGIVGCADKTAPDATSASPIKPSVAPGTGQPDAGQQAVQSGFAAEIEAKNKKMEAEMLKRNAKP